MTDVASAPAEAPAEAPPAAAARPRASAARAAGALRKLRERAGALGAPVVRGWPLAVAVVTAAWVAVALAGGDGSPVTTTAAGGAAAAGTAALVGASWRPHSPEGAPAAVLALLVLPVTVAAASAGRPKALALLLSVVGAAELVRFLRDGRRDGAPAAAAAGCGLLVAAVVATRLSSGAWALPGDGGIDLALTLAGAALLLAAAALAPAPATPADTALGPAPATPADTALGPARATPADTALGPARATPADTALGPARATPLAVPAVLLATAAAVHLPATGGPVVAAAVAVAAALVAPHRPVLAYATLAVGAGAAAVPLGPAPGLLAAAAVLSLALRGPAGAVLGLPGAAALAAAVVPPGGGAAGTALLVGAAGVAAAVVRGHVGRRDAAPLAVPPEAVPAVVLGAWLVVAPGTWRWAGATGLGAYDRGVAVAAAVAALALLGTGAAALAGVPVADAFAPAPVVGRRAHARRRRPPRGVGAVAGWFSGRREPHTGASGPQNGDAGRPSRSRGRRTAPPAPAAPAGPTLDEPEAAAPPAPSAEAPEPPAPPPPAPPAEAPEPPAPPAEAPEPPAPPAPNAAPPPEPPEPATEGDEGTPDAGPVVVVRPPGVGAAPAHPGRITPPAVTLHGQGGLHERGSPGARMPPAQTSNRRPSPAARRSWMWRYRRLLFLVTLLAFTALSGSAYLVVRVPLPPEVPQDQTTILTDVNGARLASLDSGENRVPVKLEQVPEVLVDAVLAAEDKEFFDHPGIDPAGIARAAWADLRGQALQGGSTITQQYVKNVYLTSERTIMRKLKEAVLAVKLERRYDKPEILERYLNTIYLGRGAYGVQAASRSYFGKDVAELGLREAAYLVGLIRQPEVADASKAPEAATARRTRILTAMERTGAITKRQRAEAEKEPVTTYVIERGKAETTFARPDKGTQYFVEYVRRQLEQQYGRAALYSGGLRVRTTLDLELQTKAYDAVYGFLDRPDDPSAALVAIDENGQVRAMVGGRNWDAPDTFSKVNLAVGRDGGGTGRQPGSTFKPFVLATAVRDGYSAQSPLAGPPEITFPKADQGRDYLVRNFEDADFGETVNLVDATKNSVNTVYAQLIKVVGAAKVAELAHQAGIRSPLVENISLALGTSEVSVLEMASAFSTFANRGVHVEPSVILDVTHANGKVLRPAPAPVRKRVLDRGVADVVTHALQQVVQSGSGTQARIGTPVAGKTGTTQDFGDAWFVGYTPKLTTAVWMGFPEGNVRKMDNVRGREVNGGSFPALLFRRFMSEATKGVDSGGFPGANLNRGKPLKPPSGVVLPTTTTTSTTPPTTAVQPTPPPTEAPATTTTAVVAKPPETTTTTIGLLGLGGG